IKHILAHSNPELLIEDLTDHEIDKFVQSHYAAGGGMYALNRSLAVWRRVHNMARKKWKQKTHVIDWMDFHDAEKKRNDHIEVNEAKRLIAVASERLSYAIRWSLLTGTRRSATYKLEWDKIDIAKGKATVTEKGGGEHTIWLTAELIELLMIIPR